MTEIKDEERFRTIDDILAFAIKKEEEAAAAYGTMIATARTLLIFAARKEHKAAQLYSALALRSTKDGQRKLFEFLAGQEKTHKLRLESEYERHVLGED